MRQVSYTVPNRLTLTRWGLLIGLLASFSLPSTGAAQVTQPDGTVVPPPHSSLGCDSGSPVGLLPLFACICEEPGVCNIGEVCASESSCPDGRNGTCESRMFHTFNDNSCIPSQFDGLDPWADASTLPATYSPTCSLTFTVESDNRSRFRNVFGWYNVTDSAPSTDDLHVILGCDVAQGDSVSLDVRSEPDYRGGEVGFFLLTPEAHGSAGECADGDCCPSIERLNAGEGYAYYSEREFNPDAADSFVHLLVYDSVISDRKFYFAWEDTFNGSFSDFTDLVTSVSGVECAGAGADCDTGGIGACSQGITRCEGGVLECVPRFTGEEERCDGLDNDCDGEVDEAPICGSNEVCDNGACTPHCRQSDEFRCLGVRTLCDEASGICVEPACQGVTCGADETCRGGDCRSECDGIVCPQGQVCQLDQCVDACQGVSCASGMVCLAGLCLPGCNQCDGIVCSASDVCDMSTGACHHPGCPSSCPAGQSCSDDTGCHDACQGVICPRGETCEMGYCAGREDVDAGPSTPFDGGPNGPRIDGSVGTGDGGTGGTTSPGCACRMANGSQTPTPWALLGLVGLVWFRARRRR